MKSRPRSWGYQTSWHTEETNKWKGQCY